MSNAKRIETEKGAIEVSRVYTSDFQKEGSLTAELKQTVVTKSYYPSKSVDSNLQDNIFGAEDFGYEEQEFVSERTNVAWINVPMGTTPEQIKAKLDAIPTATIYRIVSNHPILSDNQVYGINQGLTTKDNFAEKQVIRHGADDKDGKWFKDDLVIDELGRPMYKACFFSKDAKEDVNRCTENPLDFYATESIKAEMAGVSVVVKEQTI